MWGGIVWEWVTSVDTRVICRHGGRSFRITRLYGVAHSRQNVSIGRIALITAISVRMNRALGVA